MTDWTADSLARLAAAVEDDTLAGDEIPDIDWLTEAEADAAWLAWQAEAAAERTEAEGQRLADMLAALAAAAPEPWLVRHQRAVFLLHAALVYLLVLVLLVTRAH